MKVSLKQIGVFLMWIRNVFGYLVIEGRHLVTTKIASKYPEMQSQYVL